VALDLPDQPGRRKRFGNMILSRYPVGQVLRYTLPWEADATNNMPRMLIEAVVATPSGPLRVMTTHLEYSSVKLRAAQVEGIREAHRTACARVALPRKPGEGTYAVHAASRSAILTGDFNMQPGDPAKLRLSDPFSHEAPRLVDAWRALNGDVPHPNSFCVFDQTYGPAHCCDFIFITDDLAPRLRRVFYDGDTKVSDHQPVLVELDDQPRSGGYCCLHLDVPTNEDQAHVSSGVNLCQRENSAATARRKSQRKRKSKTSPQPLRRRQRSERL
jgi:endonuclease/exonuclease/phosphatase family metal-dependent hydrolase